MSNDVLLGAVLSVPIGIATGLAVTPLQRWFENRGKAKAVGETKRAEAEYKNVLFYRQHPDEFTQYLVQVAIRTTLIGAAVGIFSGFFFTVGQFIEITTPRVLGFLWVSRRYVEAAGYLCGQLVTILSSVIVVKICMPAMTLWRRVRHFDLYIQGVPSDVRIPDAEADVPKRIIHDGAP